jgi:hypothetical protein
VRRFASPGEGVINAAELEECEEELDELEEDEVLVDDVDVEGDRPSSSNERSGFLPLRVSSGLDSAPSVSAGVEAEPAPASDCRACRSARRPYARCRSRLSRAARWASVSLGPKPPDLYAATSAMRLLYASRVYGV